MYLFERTGKLVQKNRQKGVGSGARHGTAMLIVHDHTWHDGIKTNSGHAVAEKLSNGDLQRIKMKPDKQVY